MKAYPEELYTLTFNKEDWNSETREIFINLNDNLWFHTATEERIRTHRRTFQQIRVASPSGKVVSMIGGWIDGVDIIYEGPKNIKLRLGFA